jgi:hypothetical protein
LLLILHTYTALREQGFYEPHVRVTPKGNVERVQEDDGPWSALIQMHVNAEVCTQAPTKVDFINALGFIQPEAEDEALAVAKGGASRAWYQLVADRVFPSCLQNSCLHSHWTCQVASQAPNARLSVKNELKLIRDCYVSLPRVALDPMQEHPVYWLTDEYDSINCCSLNSESRLCSTISFTYGNAVAKDIL